MALAFLGWVLLLILSYILWVLVDVLIALIIAAAVMPVVQYIRAIRLPPGDRRVPKWTAVLFIYAIIALLAVFLVYLIGRILLPELGSLITTLPQLELAVIALLDSITFAMGLGTIVPSGAALSSELGPILDKLASSLVQIGTIVGNVVFVFYPFFFIVILALFLIEESEVLMQFWVSLFPPSKRENVYTTTTHIGERVGHWILGQLTVATITGVLAAVGSWLIGLPYPFLTGIITGLLELAPVIGPSYMAIPTALIGLTISPLTAILAVLLFYGLSFLDAHVLTPYITGRFVQMNLTLVLIVVVMGLALYGVIGALIAVPVTAGLVVIFDEVFFPWLRRQEIRE